MSVVKVKENESIDSALRRLRKECNKAGLPREMRKREHYEKPSECRKRKAEAAKRSAKKKKF